MLRSFKICNKRSDKYTLDSVLGTSNIDITASTDNMWESMIDWRVTDDVVDSDHKSITFSININRFNKGNSENWYVGSENKIDETKYNYKKTDWECYKRILEAHLAEEMNEDVIMTAIDESTTRMKERKRGWRKQVAW